MIVCVSRYLGEDYNSSAGNREAVTAAQLPALARQSFPLCMQVCSVYRQSETAFRGEQMRILRLVVAGSSIKLIYPMQTLVLGPCM